MQADSQGFRPRATQAVSVPALLPRPEFVLLGVVGLIIAYLVVAPLALLIVSSFRQYQLAGSISYVFTLDNYRATYLNPAFPEALANSLVYALGGTALSLLMGVGLAWVVERTNVPLGGLFTMGAGAVLFIPGVLMTLAWVLLLSPRIGLINHVLRLVVPTTTGPLDINSMAGMVWAFSSHLYPLVFLMMVGAFRSMDPALEEAAAVSGGSTWATLRRVTLGISTPALISAALIMFVRGLESFEVPLMIGIPARIKVLTTEIYSAASLRQPPEFGVSAAMSIALLAMSVVGIYLYQKATANARAFSTITGKGYRPHRMDLGGWRYPVAAACLLFFVFTLVLPLLALVWVSLFPFVTQPSAQALQNITIKNFEYVVTNGPVLDSFKNTVVNSVLVATAVVLLTTVAAWITVRSHIPGRGILDTAAFLPIAIPGTIIGVSVLMVYLNLPIPLYGTIFIISIAHITMYLPYGMRVATDALLRVHPELEEAGALSGASWLATYRHILVPLLMPGLVAAWIYVVSVSFRELSAAIFLAGPQSRVVSVLMYSLWKDGNTTSATALGIVVLLVLLVLTFLAQMLGRAMGTRSSYEMG